MGCKCVNCKVILYEFTQGVNCDVYECKDCGNRWRKAWDDDDPRHRTLIAAASARTNEQRERVGT